MPGDLNIDHSTFGQLSDMADCLVIEISDQNIGFCELQSEQNKPLFIAHYPLQDQLNHVLNEDLLHAIKHFRFSEKPYKHVYVNYFEKQFTLCPTAFYNEENNRTLLEFNAGPIGDKLIITDDVNSEIKLVYTIDENLKSVLDRLFPQHQLKHTLTVLSKLLLQSEELVKEDIVLAIHNNYIEVVVKQGQQLLLANQFSIKTEEDVLYYVLFILEQYQLNPLTVNITLAGNLHSNSSLVISLKKYIKTIHLALGHKGIDWSAITGAPQHFNYTLLNRLFCE
ncbi:MAG: hypothetical protein K0S53_1260 [Bacteroidetes bacterium]|jgi:hypothetical protein|nr:hypothetical protein [Bacteroidota bacterium]MDF2452643.1 hypothetical protein [Bacteroidota bacterium]